jgi:hypothetical protein
MSEKSNEFVFEDWVRDGIRGLRRQRMTLLPEEFWAHMRSARKERLLAYRSLIDAVIERIDETPAKKKAPTRIKVE